MPTGFTVVDVFKYAVANLVTKATGATIALLDNPIVLTDPETAPIGVTTALLLKLAIAIRILVVIGVTVFLLLRLIVATRVLVATGVTVAFEDSEQIAIFVTTATGETLDLEERFATPTGLPDLEPKGDSVTLLLRLIAATLVLVATGLAVAFEDNEQVAVFVTTATGETLELEERFIVPVGFPDLEPKGDSVTLLLKPTTATLVLVATGLTVVFEDNEQVAVFVTTAIGETLALEERFTFPVGLPDLEPKGDSVTLLLRLTTATLVLVATGLTVTLLLKPTTATFVLVATGVTVVLLLKLTTATFVLVAAGVTVVLLLRLIDATFVLVAAGVTVVLLLKLIVALLILVATGVTVALLLSLTTDVYIGVTRVLEDMDTLPITVLAGGLMVTFAEDPADINPVLVPEEAPNETPKTPNLGPPRRPAIGIAIY
jgi:hypothetical protein